MYKKLESLHPAQVRELLELRGQVQFKESKSHRRRMGVSGVNRLSNYLYSRWLTWTSQQRQAWLEVFPKNVTDVSLINWFVTYPKGSGFLDRIETWVGDRSPSYLTCYCMAGTGRILLNDVEVKCAPGEGITFPLSTPHEIPESLVGSVWACAMHMDNIWGDDAWEGRK